MRDVDHSTFDYRGHNHNNSNRYNENLNQSLS